MIETADDYGGGRLFMNTMGQPRNLVAACDSAEWLAHPGTVGKIVLGELSVLDDDMQPMPKGNQAHCGSSQPLNSVTQ